MSNKVIVKCINCKEYIYFCIVDDDIFCPHCGELNILKDYKKIINIQTENPYIDSEEEIMKHLSKAMNLFNKLKQTHPSHMIDFVNGIHKCQDVIIHRIAQRDHPKYFPVKD